MKGINVKIQLVDIQFHKEQLVTVVFNKNCEFVGTIFQGGFGGAVVSIYTAAGGCMWDRVK